MLFSYIYPIDGDRPLGIAQWSVVARLMLAAAVAALIWLVLWSAL
jgi:hypothetical protein